MYFLTAQVQKSSAVDLLSSGFLISLLCFSAVCLEMCWLHSFSAVCNIILPGASDSWFTGFTLNMLLNPVFCKSRSHSQSPCEKCSLSMQCRLLKDVVLKLLQLLLFLQYIWMSLKTVLWIPMYRVGKAVIHESQHVRWLCHFEGIASILELLSRKFHVPWVDDVTAVTFSHSSLCCSFLRKKLSLTQTFMGTCDSITVVCIIKERHTLLYLFIHSSSCQFLLNTKYLTLSWISSDISVWLCSGPPESWQTGTKHLILFI